MGLDPHEWRTLQEIEQRLEKEDPDLAGFLSFKAADRAARSGGVRARAMSVAMAILMVGFFLIGRVANTSPPQPEAEDATPGTTMTETTMTETTTGTTDTTTPSYGSTGLEYRTQLDLDR